VRPPLLGSGSAATAGATVARSSGRRDRSEADRRPRSDPGPDSGAGFGPRRALAPVGAVLLLAVTVALAGAVGAAALSVRPAEPPPRAALAAEAAAGAAADPGGAVTVVHRGGEALPTADLRVRIRVDGEPIARQPPVPFFSARGFESGPTGPFNRGWRGPWTAGTAATLELAGTNTPVDAGSTVEVRIYVDGRLVAVSEARAG
jgi:FlaG/FlaF family flagellin (archaellin)